MCVLNCRRKAGCPLLARLGPAVVFALLCALAALVIECRVKLLRGRPRSAGQQHLRPAFRALNQFPRYCLGERSRLAQDRSSVSTEQYVPCAKRRGTLGAAAACLSLHQLPVSSIHPVPAHGCRQCAGCLHGAAATRARLVWLPENFYPTAVCKGPA